MKELFRKISPEELHINPFNLLKKDWMLITAGPPDDYNTMTAGWGGLGVLWGRDIAFCLVRPVRHTYKFMEDNDNFTLCFFAEEYKDALQFCGTKSGREVPDKGRAAGLTPIPGTLPSTTAFAEASLVLECRKIYFEDLDPSHFLDSKIEEWYPQKDYHRLYVGEIQAVWKRQH